MLAVFFVTNTAVISVSAQEQNQEYNIMNENDKKILEFKVKEKIYSEILNGNETIDLSEIYNAFDDIDYDQWREDVRKIFYELCGDNYILAVLNNTEGYKLGVKYISNYNNKYALKYNPETEYEADRIIKQYINDDLSDLEKEMILVHYLIDNCKYDEKTSNDNMYIAESAYGALIDKEATSAGYAEAIKLLLNKASIECEIVSSDYLNHKWNVVKINNKYYQLDVSAMDKEEYNYIDYSYFNFSKNKKDHYADDIENFNLYNKCTSDKFKNYLTSDEDIKILGYCYFNNEILYEEDNKLYLENVNKNKSIEIDNNGYSFINGNNCKGEFYNNYFYFVREENNTPKLYVIDLTNQKIKKCYDFDQDVSCIEYMIPNKDEKIMLSSCDISIVDNRIYIKYSNGSIEKGEELTSIEVKDEVYTAKIVDDNGMIFEKQILRCDDEVILPSLPDKEDYQFVGFDKEFTSICQDTTYTAVYKKNKNNKYQDVYNALKNILDAYNNSKNDEQQSNTDLDNNPSNDNNDNKNTEDISNSEDKDTTSDNDKKTEETENEDTISGDYEKIEENDNNQDTTNDDGIKDNQDNSNPSNTIDNKNIVVASIGVILAATMMAIIIKKKK